MNFVRKNFWQEIGKIVQGNFVVLNVKEKVENVKQKWFMESVKHVGINFLNLSGGKVLLSFVQSNVWLKFAVKICELKNIFDGLGEKGVLVKKDELLKKLNYFMENVKNAEALMIYMDIIKLNTVKGQIYAM